MSRIQGSVQVIQERKIEKIYLILFLEILKKLPKITGVYLWRDVFLYDLQRFLMFGVFYGFFRRDLWVALYLLTK